LAVTQYRFIDGVIRGILRSIVGDGCMIDDLLSLRLVTVSPSPRNRELIRNAAAVTAIPVETIDAEDAISACRCLSGDADLVLLDAALENGAIAQVVAAARASAKPAFTVLLAENGAVPDQTDAVAAKPAKPQDASRLLDGVLRVRLPSRVLLVDDSSTMRTIVSKILAATRFPFVVTAVGEGIEALELARKADFDIVFLDYNMPGFSGLETMAEFRRQNRHVTFVLMTSTQDDALAERAVAQGAAFLKKPFFPADLEKVLCGFYGLTGLNPKRA
jgi:CheY-like chemotaxis protein